MRYAINVCDLSDLRAHPLMMGILLVGFVGPDSESILEIEKGRIDTGAVIIDGPNASDPLRVRALLDLLTNTIGPRKIGRKVRCYQEGPRGGWSAYKGEK